MNRFFFVLFSLIMFVKENNAQDLFDREHSINYASHLVESKDIQRGFKELNRIINTFGINDTITTLFISNSFNSGLYKVGRNGIGQYIPVNDSLRIAYVKLQLLSGDSSVIPLSDTSTRLQSFYIHFSSPGSRTILDASADNRAIIERPAFQGSYRILSNYKTKSPVVAGFLSVIPGLGKIYSGKKQDGLVSLALVTITGFVSYRMFLKGGASSIPGWIYGALGCGFYIGNIYGGQKAAKDYNRKLKKDYINVFESEFIHYTP